MAEDEIDEKRQRGKDLLRSWFQTLDMESDLAEKQNLYSKVEHYDLQRQILTVVGRVLNAQERNPGFMHSRRLLLKIQPVLLDTFTSDEQRILNQIISTIDR